MLKTAGKILFFLLLALLVLAAALVIWLSAMEPRPESAEPAAYMPGPEPEVLRVGDALRLMSFNIGYAALGAESDFFMDGGSGVRPSDAGVISGNLSEIMSTIVEADADYCLLQETDRASHRSYGADECAALVEGTFLSGLYAWNYRCAFVPFPLPPIGKVDSGLLLLSRYALQNSAGDPGGERLALPCPFSWPIRTANLKRCLLVSRTPVAGTDRELVVVDLHLEAYDDGEGKLEQTRALMELLAGEYAKGNYVVAGGDFNCAMPGTLERYPIADGAQWTPGVLLDTDAPAGFSFAFDADAPSCRLLDAPWDGSGQTYVIDGFLVSDNLTVDAVRTLDLDFQNSDHNPVILDIRLA